ncbi:vascular endothelial zinc finger 1-like isoform X3 [Leucoraja erinacea]|uniref:vascular endothelial zinc finger 1-like isoform X3 n=1 Tax=Leucoraja erinaceus TaxID=7782 RepID=UPI002458D6FD|nr:vascular endothelial zinc finger 1-like isoform X3 [Leucoraja erinacea]
MEATWGAFIFQAADVSQQQHQQHVQNSLLPILHSVNEPREQVPVTALPTAAKSPDPKEAPKPLMTVEKKEKTRTPVICSYCSKAFRDSYHLRRHESCHTGIKLVSRPRKVPTMVSLMSSAPSVGATASLVSTVAGMLTTTAASTSTITSSSTPPVATTKNAGRRVKKNHGCELCGKAFRDVYHLNRHKLSHSDEKPFECPVCQQRFKRKDRMSYHVRSHEGGINKPYICSLCGKGFSRPDHLSCHVKHVHSTERPFKCQTCEAAFATKDRLRSHMIRHEGKVSCHICGKLLSAAYISNHIKMHNHNQNHNCNVCNKDFPPMDTTFPLASPFRGGLHYSYCQCHSTIGQQEAPLKWGELDSACFPAASPHLTWNALVLRGASSSSPVEN